MDSGFYAACAGLRAQSQALEVAAHNLANLNTAGFRGQQTAFQSLIALARPATASLLNQTTYNYGVLEGTHLDLSAGNLESTGNPLDLGIQGDGFFTIQTSRGTRYTRNGNFRVSPSGQLVTGNGDLVPGSRRSRVHQRGWNAVRKGRGRRPGPAYRVLSWHAADLRRPDSAGRARRQRAPGAPYVGPAGCNRVFQRECCGSNGRVNRGSTPG